MSKSIFLFLVCALGMVTVYGASPCSTGANSGDNLFFTVCEAGTSYTSPADYTLNIANKSQVIINGNITINGTLTIDLGGSEATIFVQSPYTLTATNIVFTGNPGAGTAKVLEVEGPDGAIDVSSTIDFNGLYIDIDGTGSISADIIDGADNVECTGNVDATCPDIDVNTCNDGGSGACTNEGLPIELVFFDLSINETQIQINWSTYTEINNDYFSIEKSTDGINYTLITTVDGAGNSLEQLYYSYTDKNSSFGRSYYRLKQTDFDGTSETFAPVAVDFTSLNDGKLSFSNPVRPGESVSIFTGAEESESLSIVVFNMFGQEVISKTFEGSEYNFTVDTNVKPGIYFVKVASKSTEKTGRLVVK